MRAQGGQSVSERMRVEIVACAMRTVYSCRGGGIMRTFEIPALTTGASASFLAGAFEAFLAGISSLRAARGNAVEQGWLEVGGAVHAPR